MKHHRWVGRVIWITDARTARSQLEKHRDRKMRIWHGKPGHLCYTSCTITFQILYPRSTKRGYSSNPPQVGTEQGGHQARSHVHACRSVGHHGNVRILVPEARGTVLCAGTGRTYLGGGSLIRDTICSIMTRTHEPGGHLLKRGNSSHVSEGRRFRL